MSRTDTIIIETLLIIIGLILFTKLTFDAVILGAVAYYIYKSK